MKSLIQYIVEAQSSDLQKLIDEIKSDKVNTCSIETAKKLFESICQAFWNNKAKEIKDTISAKDMMDGSLYLFNDSCEAFICRYENDNFIVYNVNADEENKNGEMKGPEKYSESDFEKEFKAFQKRALDEHHSSYMTYKGSNKYFENITL